MEVWVQVLIGFGGCMTPVVLAAMARDRSLMASIASIKEDTAKTVNVSANALHERVNRIRDEFVRRDDLESHLSRFDKRMDEMRDEMRRSNEKTEQKLDAILKQLPGRKAV